MRHVTLARVYTEASFPMPGVRCAPVVGALLQIAFLVDGRGVQADAQPAANLPQRPFAARAERALEREKAPLPGPLFEADDGVRTRDPQLGKLMLYQLSYVRAGAIVAASMPS
jgi:hypothetical protein